MAMATMAKLTISPIPDDLLLSCVARVSRLYYLTLSLVSKSFRSLIVSPELYKARSLLGRIESCLYVCIYIHGDPSPSWFTLSRKLDRTTSKENSSGYVLTKVSSSSQSPRASYSGIVAVGSDIYHIGGTRSAFSTCCSSVAILDCRSHTWREAPSLRAKPLFLSKGVVDGKIYVAGLYKDSDSSSRKNFFDVFDVNTQIWDPKPPIPPPAIDGQFFFGPSTCVDGKFRMMTTEGAFDYNPKEGRWDFSRELMFRYPFSRSHCWIDNILYSAYSTLGWYDTEARRWKGLRGLVGLPTFSGCVKLADYGGKIAVFWVLLDYYSSEKRIWCAEIALEMRNNREIWGKVEWIDHVLSLPSGHNLLKVLVATV